MRPCEGVGAFPFIICPGDASFPFTNLLAAVKCRVLLEHPHIMASAKSNILQGRGERYDRTYAFMRALVA